MAEERAGTAGEHRGHPSPLGAERTVANRVDASVHAQESPPRCPMSYGAPIDAERPQLLHRNDSPLAFRKTRDRVIAWGCAALCLHAVRDVDHRASIGDHGMTDVLGSRRSGHEGHG